MQNFVNIVCLYEYQVFTTFFQCKLGFLSSKTFSNIKFSNTKPTEKNVVLWKFSTCISLGLVSWLVLVGWLIFQSTCLSDRGMDFRIVFLPPIDRRKKKYPKIHPHLLQAQEALALLFFGLVERPGTESYPAPSPNPTTSRLKGSENRHDDETIPIYVQIQSTLVISTSVISNNRLSRRKNLVLVITQKSKIRL